MAGIYAADGSQNVTIVGGSTSGNAAATYTNPGVSGTMAQNVQGITGGTPVATVNQDTNTPVGSPFSMSAVGTVFSVDTTGYNSIAVQLSGTFVATVNYEASNNNVDWQAVSGNNPSTTTGGAGITDTAAGLRIFPVVSRYFRARVSAYTSGTVVTTPVLRSTALSLPQSGVAVTNTPVVSLGAGGNNVGNFVSIVSSASGGLTTISRVVSAAASTNATLAKSSAGRVYKITGFNAAASIRWLKLYSKATAPVPGTDTPFFQLPLPPGAFSFDAQDIGYYFSTGIGYALSVGAADNDATALTAGDILNLNVWYQ